MTQAPLWPGIQASQLPKSVGIVSRYVAPSGDTTGASDVANIQAALNGGGKVLLGVGTFYLNAPLTIGSNTELCGYGALSILAPSFATAQAAVITNDLVNGNSNVTFRDFRLDRGGSNVQHGILLNAVAALTVDGVEIVGVPSATSGALAVSGVLPNGSPAVRAVSTDVRVQNCLFQSANNFGVQLSYVTNAVIDGCVFDDCYREAVGVEPEAGCTATNVSVTGCVFTVNTIPGGGSATGVIVITESSGGTIQQVSVSNCSITNLNPNTDGNPGVTVLTAGARGVSFANVNINGMNGWGYSIGSASYATTGVSVVGGSVINCNNSIGVGFAGAAISLRQAQNCTIQGVYIKGTHHTAGIYESSGAARNQILGNQLVDAAGAFVLLAGSGSVAKGNLVRTNSTQTTATRVTITGTYTMNPWEPPIVAATSTTAAYTVTLPAANAVPAGLVYTLVDESNGAGTHNITLSCAGTDTFTDGGTTKAITTNGGDMKFYSTGTAWQIV